MIIEKNNITWNPKEDQVGANFIEIEAFDGINKAKQSFTIFVNDIPQIVSRDSLQIEIGETLHHFIKAQDANTTSKITYGIQSDLRDLTISPKTGEIIWTPTIEDVGYHTISASVSDEFSDLGKAVQPITIFVYKNPQFDNALLPEAYAESNYKQAITATNMFNRDIPEKDVFINLVESTFQEILFDQLTYELIILPRLDEVGLQYVTLEVTDQYNNKSKESFPISVLTSPCEIVDTTYFNEDDPHKIERSTSTIQKQYIKKKPTILEKTGELIKNEPAQYMTIEEINITEIIDTVFLTTVEVKKYFPELSAVIQNQEVSSELSKKELRKLKKLQREKEKKARKIQNVQKEKIQSNNITFNKVKEETNFSDKILFKKPEAPLPKKIDLYKVKNEVKRKTVLAIMDDLKQNIIQSTDNTKTQTNLVPLDQELGHNLRGIKTPLNDKWKKKEYLDVLDFTTPEFNYKLNSWNGFTGERKVN
ncbi:hypothetical protein OAQ87_00030 [Candidatus Marinimicrobia bacterium]|nr:hypothetical protein [Candidatus Neomarinimicrobiota bacterium]